MSFGISTVLEKEEIINSLQSSGGEYVVIDDMDAYADKVLANGSAVCARDKGTGQLLAFIIYYNNAPQAFITMVWTSPAARGKGIAQTLLLHLIQHCKKEITLKVHVNNDARHLYATSGFTVIDQQGDELEMKYQRKLTVMQPYIFPYIGYFQLITAADEIIFYDDVNYIKGGWINRNRILMNGKDNMFTIPLDKASPNRLIKDIETRMDERVAKKFSKTLSAAYGKAPHFQAIHDLVMGVFSKQHTDITEMAIDSIRAVHQYLGLELNYVRSSNFSPETMGMDRSDRLISMIKAKNYSSYINPAGGSQLYDKDYFAQQNLELWFLRSKPIEYPQFKHEFVPWLSIIDVLMFNDVETVKQFLNRYTLE